MNRINERFAQTPLGRFFKLKGSGAENERDATLWGEIRAGFATFVTMAYIVAVNATIIADSGGTCVCDKGPGVACIGEEAFEACVYEIKKDLVTATAAISCLATFIIGVTANLPLGFAPGMGLNAYFVYTVIGFYGSGKVTYATALTAIFLEGIFFMVLTFFGFRQLLTKIIPASIRAAMCAGIGMFLAGIGLQKSAGLGLVVNSNATLVTLGGCPDEYADGVGGCSSHGMESPTMWIGLLGWVIMGVLLTFRVKGATLLGILFVSICSWPRGTAITAFPYTANGDAQFDFFKQVVTFHPIKHTLGVQNWKFEGSEVWVALFTFLYVDILEATSGMFSLVNLAGLVDEWGDFPGSFIAFMLDGLSISIGALFGTSPITAYGESGVGIADGGKTGLTAATISFLFFLSLFFAPIFASFPVWATGPALLVVGTVLMQFVREINWDHMNDALPAFVTILLMPLTYSIAYGIIGGLGTYAAISLFSWIINKISGDRLAWYTEGREVWLQDGVSLQPPWLKYIIKPKNKPAPELEKVEVDPNGEKKPQ